MKTVFIWFEFQIEFKQCCYGG